MFTVFVLACCFTWFISFSFIYMCLLCMLFHVSFHLMFINCLFYYACCFMFLFVLQPLKCFLCILFQGYGKSVPRTAARVILTFPIHLVMVSPCRVSHHWVACFWPRTFSGNWWNLLDSYHHDEKAHFCPFPDYSSIIVIFFLIIALSLLSFPDYSSVIIIFSWLYSSVIFIFSWL